MIEIEKTFLIKEMPDLSSAKCVEIKQGYFSSEKAPLRIRQYGDNFEITKKIQLKENDRSSQEEINIPLTKYEFDKLWPLVERYLEKTRYYVDIGNGLVAEVNIFKGKLFGLQFIEVEFKSEEEMQSFKAPDWFGNDITQEDFSANSFLAGKSFEEVRRLFNDA